MTLNIDERTGPFLVYFSSTSENTRRFIGAVGIPASRIPLRAKEPPLVVDRPFVLVTPTYGGGDLSKAVPRQVIRFLNDIRNRTLLRGVITSGNVNFCEAYCAAGVTIAAKCGVPELYRFELLGTHRDVTTVRDGLRSFWSVADMSISADTPARTSTKESA